MNGLISLDPLSWAALLLNLVLGSIISAAIAVAQPQKRPLSIFNLDSTHYTNSEFGDDKMNAEGLREYVHRILGNGAFTHFFICPGAQTTLCDTKTMSPTWWRIITPL
mgnify:CR=1 FL=1